MQALIRRNLAEKKQRSIRHKETEVSSGVCRADLAVAHCIVNPERNHADLLAGTAKSRCNSSRDFVV